MSILTQDIKYLKGVGPKRAKLLGDELKVFTLQDLLYTFPYKYIDRSEILQIKDLQEGMPYVQLKGEIISFAEEGQGRKRRITAIFTDGTGYADLVWFAGLKYIRDTYKIGVTYLLLGKPGIFNHRFSFSHPEIDKANDEAEQRKLGFQPIYSIPEKMRKAGFTSRAMTMLMYNAFDALGVRKTNSSENSSTENFQWSTAGGPIGQQLNYGSLERYETLPQYIITEHTLRPLHETLLAAHFPRSADDLPSALHRLKFEELFYMQLDILRYMKNRRLKTNGFVFKRVGETFLKFYNDHLPFQLTEAQKRVIREIRKDTGNGVQMNRLLQGDVGSGKTVVALMSMLLAIDNGFQACIMAPTEILAEQHLATIKELLGSMPLRVELLTGIVKGKQRREILQATADGSVNILIGTHALIEPTVKFLNLGLVVIDEQHRFGVKQRARLWEKNLRPPHILVMTATPIPRTLAMTVYGDLDVSVIDQLPPGRKPVHTVHYYDSSRQKLYEGMRYQLRLGRQAYVVFPLIQESEKIDLKNLEDGFNDIVAAFPEYCVGKVHGKMKSGEKDAQMQDFIQRKTQILVSTTVIEVGVNVPNASVMAIWDAQRFGLAQLHQLRGRVGRGADQSYCVLVTKPQLSEDTRRRIQIMTETNDGFEIAEEDLKLRGPGDLEGTQQSGIPFDLKVANIVKDSAIMQHAREAAEKVLHLDPDESLPQNAVLWRQLQLLKDDKKNYSAIS